MSRFYFALFLCFVLISFVVQFSMTGLPPFRALLVSLSRRLDYYITSFASCQYLFQNFFKFFSSFFLLLLSRLGSFLPPQTACTLYYLFSLLSIPFLKFFGGWHHFVNNAQIPHIFFHIIASKVYGMPAHTLHIYNNEEIILLCTRQTVQHR